MPEPDPEPDVTEPEFDTMLAAGEPTTASPPSPEQWERLLREGARGTHAVEAAVHLLTFTSAIYRRDFANQVEVRAVGDAGDRAAFVRSWPGLLAAANLWKLAESDRRLLAIAAALTSGEYIELRLHTILTGFGWAHARRVMEAVGIAAGAAGLFDVVPTWTLDKLIADRDTLTGTPASWPPEPVVQRLVAHGRRTAGDEHALVAADPAPVNLQQLAFLLGWLHDDIRTRAELLTAAADAAVLTAAGQDITWRHRLGGDPVAALRAAAQELHLAVAAHADAADRVAAAAGQLAALRPEPAGETSGGGP